MSHGELILGWIGLYGSEISWRDFKDAGETNSSLDLNGGKGVKVKSNSVSKKKSNKGLRSYLTSHWRLTMFK